MLPAGSVDEVDDVVNPGTLTDDVEMEVDSVLCGGAGELETKLVDEVTRDDGTDNEEEVEEDAGVEVLPDALVVDVVVPWEVLVEDPLRVVEDEEPECDEEWVDEVEWVEDVEEWVDEE